MSAHFDHRGNELDCDDTVVEKLAAERARADRLADWMSDADHRYSCPARQVIEAACDCGLYDLLDEHDRMREAER